VRGVTFRTLLFVVAVAFSVGVVGVISVSTYAIFLRGITQIAVERADRYAELAVDSARFAAVESREWKRTPGSAETTETQFIEALDAMRPRTGFGSLKYTLFDEHLRPLWETDRGQRWGTDAARQRALEGRGQESVERPGVFWSGLFGRARLTAVVRHEPIELPDGRTGVLDIAYIPVSEERVIDSLRFPMLALALTSMAMMALVIQVSMMWLLRLISRLRDAADSIDAGRLDDRLPDFGSNEVGDLARSLNRLIDRLQRRADAQSQFVANASHELATPVAGIRGYVDILKRWGADDPDVRDEAVAAIDRESGRMSRLTNELLGMLQSEGGLVFKHERYDLNAVVRLRLASTASVWLDKHLEFEGPMQDELICYGDPDRLEDVLSILLENAAKYTPEGGSITVRTSRLRDHVAIEVSDTGPGIPPDDLEGIFDRFYRSATHRAGSQGFGLGLSIAKNIVDLAGGSIEVRSVQGEGATFIVRWPRGRH
jgi:signal transduction histidine kinase